MPRFVRTARMACRENSLVQITLPEPPPKSRLALPRDFEEVLDRRGIYLLPLPDLEQGSVLLYAPCVDLMLTISSGEAQFLRRAKGDPQRFGELFEALTGVTLSLLADQKPPKMTEYLPTSVALMMTTACQLRCTYCYADAGNTPVAYLTEQTATAAIDFICNNAVDLGRKSVTVHFHGAGEPTLAWGLILHCMTHAKAQARDRDLCVRMVLTTNLCIDPKKAVFVGRNLDAILVSCDGPPDVMTKSRPMLGGNSGEVILAALKAIVDDGNSDKLWIRSTITRSTQGRLVEFVQFFHQLGVKNLYLVPVSASGRGINEASVQIDEYLEAWQSAKSCARRLGVNLESPVANPQKLHPDGYACGISGSNFAVMPTGEVSLCYEAVLRDSPQWQQFHIGAFSEDSNAFSVVTEKLNAVRQKFHVSQRAVCDQCFCRLTCAGHCAAREFGEISNPRNVPITAGCDIIRSITATEISDLLKGATNGC